MTRYSETARWSGVALRQRRNSKWPRNRLALQSFIGMATLAFQWVVACEETF